MSTLREKVETFLKERPNTIYSLKTITRNVKGKKRHVLYVLTNSKHIRKCKPPEVGNYKDKLNIFTFHETQSV